jgi:acyl-CoA synthetase (AMP-forming)/AMP-acid ligase II
VVEEQGNDVKPNVVGEFIIKSPMVMKEYYKKPEETKSTIKNGWLYTGDLATIDEEELRSFCRQKLAGYKVPRRIIIEEQLPRNASGKILKYQLRQKLNQVNA